MESMTRLFPERGMAFPLLISEESGEVVERCGRREAWFLCWLVLASDQPTRASVSPSIHPEPVVRMLRFLSSSATQRPRHECGQGVWGSRQQTAGVSVLPRLVFKTCLWKSPISFQKS
jgi:hypothetical protein